MSKRDQFTGWGSRSGGRGPAHQQSSENGGGTALPVPPPGFAWVMTAAGWAMVPFGALSAPLEQQAPPGYAPPAPVYAQQPPAYAPQPPPQYAQPAYPPQPRQPQNAVVSPYMPPNPYHNPYAAPPQAPRPAPPARSCELVKPDGRDLYADLLATVPDLVPPVAHDPSQGPLPETVAALQNMPEFVLSARADLDPFGRSAPARSGYAIGTAAPPDPGPALPFYPQPQQAVLPAPQIPVGAYDPTVTTRPSSGPRN